MNSNFFILLLSNAAKYIVVASAILNYLHLLRFHVTCVADLLHNCAMEVKSQFEIVDQLIAKIKSATVKKNHASQIRYY